MPDQAGLKPKRQRTGDETVVQIITGKGPRRAFYLTLVSAILQSKYKINARNDLPSL